MPADRVFRAVVGDRVGVFLERDWSRIFLVAHIRNLRAVRWKLVEYG